MAKSKLRKETGAAATPKEIAKAARKETGAAITPREAARLGGKSWLKKNR